MRARLARSAPAQHARRRSALRSRADRLTVVAIRLIVFALVALAVVYVVEDVRVRFRMRRVETEEVLGAVTFHYATLRKDGRVEIFWDQPQTEICVRSLLPHAGYRPCWYARRSPVRTIG